MEARANFVDEMKLRLAGELAYSTGVHEEEIMKVLEELGLNEVIEETNMRFGKSTPELTKDDLRISAKVGRLLVAR